MDGKRTRKNVQWTWAGCLVVALLVSGGAAWADTVYGGNVVNDNGTVAISAYALVDGDVRDAAWTLSWALSVNAEPVFLASGTSAVGGPDSTVITPGNLFAFWGMDPNFELSGPNPAASPWTIVKSGDGFPAFVMGYEGTNAPPGGGYFAVPAQNTGGNRDNPHPAGILRSLEFTVTGDAITFRIAGGAGNTAVVPTNDDDTAGFMGVALRDASTGDYLAFTRRIGGENDWQLCGFDAGTLAGFVGRTVTLDIIDDFDGGWGWMITNEYRMLGDLPWDEGGLYTLTVGDQTFTFGVPEPATMSLLVLGGLSLLRRRT